MHMHQVGMVGKYAAVCAAFSLVVCRYSGGDSNLDLAKTSLFCLSSLDE